MTNRLLLIAALGLALAACGRVGDLEPAAGKSMPQKPALAARALTADDLLALPPRAKPRRVDELTKRGEVREPDRFDLPPPDGTAVPLPVEAGEPATASTTGPDNQDEPRR
jgi:predicted small lipoprotein YifL